MNIREIKCGSKIIQSNNPDIRPNRADRSFRLRQLIIGDASSIAGEMNFTIDADEIHHDGGASRCEIVTCGTMVGARVVIPCDHYPHGLYLEYTFDRNGMRWNLNDWGEAAAPKDPPPTEES